MTGTGSSATWARHAPPSWSNPTPSPPTASTPGGRSCSSTASGGSPTPASTSTLTPGTPAGGAPGEMALRLLRAGIQYVQGISVNVANRQTTGQSYRLGGRSRTSSAGASSLSTPPATASALLRMSRTGTTSRATRDARHWARPHGQDGHAGAGRAALEQAPRRVGRHLRGRDHLSLLSDSSTTLDGQQPVRAGRGPAACGGRRRFANWTRTRSPQAGALDEARNAMIRVSLLP